MQILVDESGYHNLLVFISLKMESYWVRNVLGKFMSKFAKAREIL